jgi:hypothetical protein
LNYFVILNGQRFGPANMTLLNQWAAEGRLGPNTLLEEEGSLRQMTASQLTGLYLPEPAYHQQPGYSPPGGWNQPASPQPFTGYYRGPGTGADNGSSDLTVAWVCSGVSILMCLTCTPIAIPLPIIGLIFASRAASKGNPGATAAKVFSIVMLVLLVVAVFGGCALIGR